MVSGIINVEYCKSIGLDDPEVQGWQALAVKKDERMGAVPPKSINDEGRNYYSNMARARLGVVHKFARRPPKGAKWREREAMMEELTLAECQSLKLDPVTKGVKNDPLANG
jgi:hypothetical protein